MYTSLCCSGDADGCIPLTMLVDLCQCCLLTFVCLLPFKTLSLLQNLATKEPESESKEAEQTTAACDSLTFSSVFFFFFLLVVFVGPSSISDEMGSATGRVLLKHHTCVGE